MKEIVNMEKNFKHRTIKDKDGKISDLRAGDIIIPHEDSIRCTKGCGYEILDIGTNKPTLVIVDDNGVNAYIDYLDTSKFTKLDISEIEKIFNVNEGDVISPYTDNFIGFTKDKSYLVHKEYFYADEGKINHRLVIFTNDGEPHELDKINLIKWRKVTNPHIMHCSGSPNVAHLSKGESSGGSVNYYKVEISNPISPDLSPCVVEFEDIALALGLTPMEYNIMKDLWRNANARTNGNGKAGNTQLRTYQKVAHYGNILLKLEERKKNESI